MSDPSEDLTIEPVGVTTGNSSPIEVPPVATAPIEGAPVFQPTPRFEDLSPADQRRAIARDVKAQLAAGRVRALNKTYFCLLPPLQGVEPCAACAVGSLFIAAFGLREGRAFDPNGDWPSIYPARLLLERYFEHDDLRLVEAAFERNPYHASGHPQSYRAVEFGDRYSKDRERLEAIMDNIVEHGEFRP